MASYVTPLRGVEFIFYVGLASQADTKLFQVNPTLAAGDVKISKDGGALNNLNTLPAVTPAGGKLVKVTVSATEMESDNAQIVFNDAAGAEWCDLVVNIQTTARQIDNLAFPVVSGRGMDVTATGVVGLDWANIEGKDTVVDLSETTIKTATDVEAAIADITTDLAALFTTEIPDSIAALGARPTVNQALIMITRFLMEKSLSGATMTVNKEDGTTASMTFTMNDSTEPTAISRTS